MQRDKPPGLRDAKKPLTGTTARNVLFVIIGVAALVLRGRYSGPGHDLVHSYGGNVAVSFAAYFWALIATSPFAARFLADPARREQRLNLKSSLPRMLAAGLALVVVQLFELLDGFGVMTNVYDPFDLVANTAGTAIAFALDASLPAARQGTGANQNPANVTDRWNAKR